MESFGNTRYSYLILQCELRDNQPWFDAIPIGEHTLGAMMTEISVAADLSQRYTNHSLRATSVTLLEDAGTEGRHIVKVTQHKSVNSLKTYGRLSDRKRKQMSNILNDGLIGSINRDTPFPPTCDIEDIPMKKSKTGELDTTIDNPIDVLADENLWNVEIEDGELDKYVQDIEIPITQNVSKSTSTNQTLFQPVFNNCNVTINYNQH